MTTSTRFSSRLCAVLGVVLAALVQTGTARASVDADAVADLQAGTARWAATLVRPDGTLSTGTAWSTTYSGLGTSYVYGNVRNTGTLALTAQTYTLSASGFLVNPPTATACVNGAWQATTGTCTGTQVALAGATALPIAVGAGVSVRLTLQPALLGGTASLSVSVSRSQARTTP
ncbi:hypothetical protein [Lentzea sp. NPDC059081]|uniref:hypothetical protein n=1 Tax=Lentzea sp. NPDC059081 TaxID=3346719 RepID=UPI003687702B